MTRMVGYSRPLGVDDDLEADAETLREAGCTVVHLERTERGADGVLIACLTTLEPGDVLLVSRAVRLAPTQCRFISTVASLIERGAVFRSLAEPGLCTESSATSMDVIAALELLHRELIGVRTREGMAAAAAAGRKPGRPTVMTAERREMARELQLHGRSKSHIARVLGVSETAVRRALLSPMP